MNIETLFNETSKELKRHKIKSSILDSEILISETIKKSREFIILNSKKKVENEYYLKLKKLVSERCKGKPIAYITKKKFFWKYEFNTNENVLIPRPDTEIVVEQALKLFKNKPDINFLDIGTGSGCIILSILKEKKNFLGTGIDISKKSLKICKINSNNLGVSNRLKLFKSDVDNFQIGKYDLIVSNPPYIKNANLKYLEKNVIGFEPRLALDGGLEGLSVIQKVIKKSSKLIKKNGMLILEIGFDQKDKVKKLLNNYGFYVNEVLKDLAKNNRCIVSTKI